MLDWNIQPRARACQNCGRAFQKGEPLHTLLFDDRQGYHRLDVCEACWQARHAEGSNHRRGFISHWVSRYEPPPPAPLEPILKETAETLLRKLLARNAPEHAGCAFILAVMLERKRVLKVKAQSHEDGRRVLVYEHARTGEVFMVPDPGLHLDQLDAVQREAARLLEHGLPAEQAQSAPTGGGPSESQSPDEPAPVNPLTEASSASLPPSAPEQPVTHP